MIDWIMKDVDEAPPSLPTGEETGNSNGHLAPPLRGGREGLQPGVWTSVNHARINSTGVEANVQLDLRRIMPSQRVLRSLGAAYAYIDQSQRREEGVQSMYALEYLRHKVVASLGLDLPANLALDVKYRFQQRRGSYTDTGGINRMYKPYQLVDARLAWSKPCYSLYVEANNLFDTDYVDYGNVPQPGLWVMAGARFSFSL